MTEWIKRDCQCPIANHRHGTREAYLDDDCRCDECRGANAALARAYRRARAERRWNGGSAWVDPTGTRRRMQALAASGWSAAQLAEHFGMTDSAVYFLKNKLSDRCLAQTADKVRRVYDELWHVTPTGNAVGRTQLWASRAGFVEPWRWEGVDIDDPAAEPLTLEAPARKVDIDEIAVDRAVAGDPPAKMTKLERAEAIRRLTERGLSAREIRGVLKLNNSRMVTRDRARVRARAA